VLDDGQRTAQGSKASFVAQAGLPVYFDGAHAIAHNKVMVIDDETVITGSFNFTESAEERNAENLIVIRSRELAAKYAANWQQHQAHSSLHTP
jgi:phosphatidylserine/phosphatidylglycerophosphate/cardiolipin synthase-like enzyme